MAFLEATCQSDEDLRQEVESLLASETEAEDFIETPVFRIWEDGDKPLAEGQRIGAYRIVREAGRGGMGAVYFAERADGEARQQVAIKLVRRGMDTDEIVRRFRAERQILANLDHPNIARLLDAGTTEDGRPYFVMEWVEGQPVDKYCEAHHLAVRERLELFRKVCSAVHFAHQNLVVHRDLKPGNILVTAEGEPKLLDFGIAKLLAAEEEPFAAFTRVGLRPMTPEFASPEQVRGEAITTASDVYALGVLLYVLLTGHSPYKPAPGDPEGLAKAICETSPPRPSTAIHEEKEVQRPEGSALRRRLAGDLDNIVLMAMKKEAQRRYASVDQLSNDIGRHLQGLPVVARKDTVGYRAAKFVGRHKLGVSLAAAVLLLIVGFSITVTLFWQRAVEERERSSAVLRFLEKIFESPNPEQARGEDVTAREVLDEGVQEIDRSLQDQPELRADLMETMGRVYLKIGLSESAEGLLQKSLRLRRQSLGPVDPKIASSLHNLSNVLRETDNDDAAEPLIREAISIQNRSGDTENLNYAGGLNNLAAILEDKGKFDEAEALYKKSLALKRRLPDADGDDIAGTLNNLGKLYYTRGNYKAAEPYYREAVAIRRRMSRGLPDPKTAINLGNLASLLEETGNLTEAEALYRESLDIRQKLYPDSHPRIARTLNNLGYLLQTKGDAEGAEKCYREAVAIADKTLGRDHQERASYLRNLAVTLLDLERPKEAETAVREAVDIFRKAERPVPWRIADAESVLGGALAAQRRFEEAEPLLVQSYPVLAKDQGNGAKRAPAALKRTTDLYIAWGKPERAAELQALAADRPASP